MRRIAGIGGRTFGIGGEVGDGAAYMITHVKVEDEATWGDYRSQLPATLTGWAPRSSPAAYALKS